MSQRIPVRILPRLDDLLQAEHDENVVREPFRPSEAVAIAEALRPIEQQAARERQGRPGQERSAETAEHSESRDRVAAAVGMGHTALRQATEVVHAAEADPTLAPLVEHMDAPTIHGRSRASDRGVAQPLGESASPGLAEGHPTLPLWARIVEALP